MEGYIIAVIIGIICIVLGIGNIRGNISTLHSYHRKRVSEENVRPFGRLVGTGNTLCGVGVSVFGIMAAIGDYLPLQLLVTVGAVIMCVCVAGGLGISFYAMIKYNKGIV